MSLSLEGWIAVVVGALVALAALQFIHLAVVLLWSDLRTEGLRYFGRPVDERRRFKRSLRWHAKALRPVLHAASRLSRFQFRKASFRYRGISAPKGTCSERSFERGVAYEPRPEDVFVVTQMKSGTTWMQHLVFQTLLRGDGRLPESGQALYAVSPWLEGRKSVSVEEAPLIGTERPSRVIKTHLPTLLCPHSTEARYVYVVRHPVSCFASCVDFIAENTGPFVPDIETVRAWFCSEEMWWGSWPAHVEGWWQRFRESDNVLFVQFEEMKRDLPGVVRQTSEFLGLSPVGDEELGRILEKCGFDYMQRQAEAFEMHPPHILATDARLFARGVAERHTDVPEEVAHRIRAWCAAELESGSYPLSQAYPDVPRAGPRVDPCSA